MCSFSLPVELVQEIAEYLANDYESLISASLVIETFVHEDLTGFSYRTDSSCDTDDLRALVNFVTKRCHSLRSLSLGLVKYSYSDEDLIALFKAFPKLETIQLSGGTGQRCDHRTSFDLIRHLIYTQQHLKVLFLPDFWLTAATAQRLLEELSDSSSHSRSLNGYNDIQFPAPARLLDLDICVGGDAPAYALITRFEHLKILSVEVWDTLDIIILRQLQNLEELCISAPDDILTWETNEQEVAFFSAFPRLKVIQLDGFRYCREPALVALGRTSRRLIKITIHLYGWSDGVDLHALAQDDGVLFPRLQEFKVTVKKPQDPESESEAKLMARLIHQHMPKLSAVSLWYSYSLFRGRVEHEWISLRADTSSSAREACRDEKAVP
ncbi:hypothetical protein K461DRAFT_301042 [Myriangium duriaei CBS 260.36]|uniref:F-box domain-containing protein n=1 Tax=Myriangium duriaei CBS 260.36 TaxID=1168546 RepID=A0A9P4MD43_9PEZI|nr:hypothetical protein K461DRAFT_301042 [Myriangium duriaei CBS 260.36]